MWWMIAISAVSTGCVLLLLGRRNERAVRRDWELLLTPRGTQLYKKVESKVQTQLDLADLAYDEAFTARELGSVDEAVQLLDVGYRIIEDFSPSMLRLLSAMAVFSRMVSAMAPVRPLRPAAFRVAEIQSLAHLNRLLHQFLVSTTERFRLKVYIIRRSFALATRYLLRSTHRIAGRASDSDREWEQVRAIREDYQTLTDDSLESLRALLVSLAADGKDDIAARLP